MSNLMIVVNEKEFSHILHALDDAAQINVKESKKPIVKDAAYTKDDRFNHFQSIAHNYKDVIKKIRDNCIEL